MGAASGSRNHVATGRYRPLRLDHRCSADGAGHGIAGIDDEGCPFSKLGEVESFVVRGDDDAILGSECFLGPIGRSVVLPLRVLAGRSDLGDVGIVIGHFCAEGLEAVEQLESGRLAHVVDVRLVGETKEKDAAAFHRFPCLVERNHGLVHDVFGHRAVDLAGELDEAGVDAEFLGFPGEVEGIDRDAMAAEAGAWIKRREAEWLGGGGADDLPDIDAHGIGDDFEFVDEANVDGPVNVFQQLGKFRDPARADGDDGVESSLI